jgi:arsenite methyltransferase
MKASYGIDGPNAIKGLLLGALALLFSGTLINFFLFKLTLANAVIHGFWWASFCIASIFLMLFSSLFGKFVMRDKLIDDLKIQGDEKILDVGCGRGLLLIAAAKKLKTGRAVGLDIWSQDDLSNNSAKNTFKNTEIENVTSKIELITGDMTAMHFNANSFDIIVSSMAIHNLPTKILREKAIQEINRVLKPGGQIA